MNSLLMRSPAKLNLFLHITGRRADGYHELQTLFQLIDFGDDIELTDVGTAPLQVHCPGLDIPPQENLAWRAARSLQEHAGTKRSARITIHKRIPDGGGLGGGSSNAATVLLGLNRLWQLELGNPELSRLGQTLGTDVPVFIGGHSAWAEGIGEVLDKVHLPVRHFLVIRPGCAVSTAEVFSRRELTRNTSPITIAAFFEGGGRNDCEPVVRRLYPEIDKALNWLENFGQAQLTGSGACVFAAFDSKAQAEAVLRRLPAQWQGFTATGINRSPAHQPLD